MANNIQVGIEGSFPVTHLRSGGYTFFIPLKDEITQLIGKIAAYWGAFEVRMDLLIKSIGATMSKDLPLGWERLGFKKRKEIFRSLIKEYTSIMFPNLSETFASISEKAAEIHWRRNIIVHGYYDIVPGAADSETGISPPTFFAKGQYKKKKYEIPLTSEFLEKIWHDISHLIGDLLVAIKQMGGVMSTPDFVIPDADLLQDQRSGNFRLLPISNRFSLMPLSSEE
jgi:hypothetical protein